MNEIKEYAEQERDEYIDSLGIEYSAVFVPFSQSRNKDDKDKSLNWLVTIKRNNQSLTTDYMQGIGHLPGYKHFLGSVSDEANEQRQRLEIGAEQGRKVRISFDRYVMPTTKLLDSPLLKDILYSLVVDSDCLDYSTFEEWADCFGYDHDSRSAEKIYRACLEIALKMRLMFGDDGLNKLREVFQDY